MTEHPNGDTPPRTMAAKVHADLGPVLDHGERLRSRVLTDELLDLTAQRIMDALQPRTACKECRQRARVPAWPVRLIRDMAEGVGVRVEIDARIMAMVGVPLTEAQAAVKAVQGASGDADEVAEQCRAYLEAYERKRGRKLLAVPFGEGG